MNEGIDVHKDDILWRFYCKRFTIAGKEVPPPENLCKYFQTSLKGMFLWLTDEVKLQSLWLIHLLTIAVLGLFSTIHPDAGNIVVRFLAFLSFVLCMFSLAVALSVTLLRLKHLIVTRAPWVIWPFIVGFIILVLTNKSLRAELWTEDTFNFILTVLKFMLASVVATVVFFCILVKIPNRNLEKLQQLAQTFLAFLKAKKDRVCPPVNPPEDFKPKQ